MCVLKENFTYCPNTGHIERITRKNSNGSIDAYGYRVIKFKKNQIKAHRLAWFLYYGHWPSNNIDHINGVKTDNRIFNLRDVEQRINTQNIDRNLVAGFHVDRKTKGLKKKYAIKNRGKTERYYTREEAKQRRQEIDQQYNYVIRRQA